MASPPSVPARLEVPYACTLDTAALDKAKKELGEDPAQRQSQVTALKNWIHEQKHMRCRTDEHYLVAILRGSKWSQLRAQEMIQNLLRAHMLVPDWFCNIDPCDPSMDDLLNKGYCLPLPKKTKDGCQILLYRLGCLPPDPRKYSFGRTIRNGILTASYTSMMEENQVHGHVFLFDYTGITMKHMNGMKIEDIKKWHKIWQKSVPGRFKELHFYNAGALFDVMAGMFKPFLNKKYQERFQVHNTAESLYSCIDKELLPEDYLPDDYQGSTIGTVDNIIRDFKQKVQSAEFRELMLYATHEYWTIDDSAKRPNDEPRASFRKLAVN